MKDQDVSPNTFVCEMLANSIEILGPRVLQSGNRAHRSHVANKCFELLLDAKAAGCELRKLRRWRRVMLRLFNYRRDMQQLLRAKSLSDIRLPSERIFEQHGWNDIDSGWRVL